jgi:hypothetical protein
MNTQRIARSKTLQRTVPEGGVDEELAVCGVEDQ